MRKAVAQDIEKNLCRCMPDRRVQRGEAQRFPQQFDQFFRLTSQQAGDGFVLKQPEILISQPQHQAQRTHAFGSAQPFGCQQTCEQMQWRWKSGRCQIELSRVMQAQRQSQQAFCLSKSDPFDHAPGFLIGPQQQVLTIVELKSVPINSARSTSHTG